MSKWGKVQGDSGILRKTEGPEKTEDLLVFGYACKLFRDDEKALEIDQGKHLIPWMGDDTLKIDRYDGRGALADLVQYEASTESYDTARWLGLTDAERRLEQLCDEERYRALHTNEDEEQMYREEELKRLHQQLSNEKNYGQVSYSYDASKPEETPNDTIVVEADDDEPFIPSLDLDLPINMTVPDTVKQNARIQKTAMFISQQGAQMEILLKAKQAGNPQFNFLSHDSPLYRYYRHILMAMKTGRYRPAEPPKLEETQEVEESDHYLHPSLVPVAPRVESAPSIPNITYKPSADCAYTMLISKIKGTKPILDESDAANSTPISTNTQQTPSIPASISTTTTNPSHTTTAAGGYNFPPNSTYLYNYATGKYEQATTSSVYGASAVHSGHVYGDNMYLQPANGAGGYSYDHANNTGEIAKGAVLYNKNGAQLSQPQQMGADFNAVTSMPQQYFIPPPQLPMPQSAVVVKEKPKPLLPIAHYSSGSDSESDDDVDDESQTKAIINVPKYVIPPEEVQLIVDKMASYVARNGHDFESIVRSKGDLRFSFLDTTHVFNAYYKHKLKMYGGTVVDEKEEEPEEQEGLAAKKQTEDETSTFKIKNESATENIDDLKSTGKSDKSKKIIAPVCFSIKKAKDPEPVPIERSALPVEESSEESDNDESEQKYDESVKDEEVPQGDSTVKDDEPMDGGGVNSPSEPVTATAPYVIQDIQSPQDQQQIIEIDDSLHELIDLTDDTEERRDAKRAEDKIKDKLAAAAREKMSQMSRNRELQIERKRRAAAFLSKIKPDDVHSVNGGTVEETTVGSIPEMHPAEEDDLMKRICDVDCELSVAAATPVSAILPVSKSSNNHKENEKKSRGHSRSRSEDKHKSKQMRKKRKKRSSSSDTPRKAHKRSKHSHRSLEKKRYKKKHRSRSRSHSSHSHKSRSRSRSHRPAVKSKLSSSDTKSNLNVSAKTEKKTERHRKIEDKSSGEISSPTSSHSSD